MSTNNLVTLEQYAVNIHDNIIYLEFQITLDLKYLLKTKQGPLFDLNDLIETISLNW